MIKTLKVRVLSGSSYRTNYLLAYENELKLSVGTAFPYKWGSQGKITHLELIEYSSGELMDKMVGAASLFIRFSPELHEVINRRKGGPVISNYPKDIIPASPFPEIIR